MSDPTRLSTERDGALEALLLRAGRRSAPSGAKQRALLMASGASAASGLAATGAAAESAAGLGAKTSTLAALKWIGALSVTGAGAVAGTVGLAGLHGHATRSGSVAAVAAPASRAGDAATHKSASSAPVIPAAVAPGIAHPDEVAPAAVAPGHADLSAPAPPRGLPMATAIPLAAAKHPPLTVVEPVAITASTLPAEIALLDQAQAAMAAGDTRRVLWILDGYSARFPRGEMTPEATLLRVEALVEAGDRAEALRLAHAFLASTPNSPYAARIESLLSMPNP